MPKHDNGLESRTNRWMVAGLVLMLVGLLAFPLYRIYEPTARAEAAEETQSNLALAGESLWSSTCASCHGSFGQGVDAPALNSVQFLSIATNEQIVAIASSGVPGTEMSAYGQAFGGPLTQEQIVSLAACIRSWEDTAPDRPDWRDMIGEGGGHDEGADPAAGHDETPADTDGDGTADHDEAPADTDGDGADAHDEAPADTDGDGADDHDQVATTEGPAACGPNYDPAAFEDHDDDGADDHTEVPSDATDHDEAPADGDGDGADGHDG